MRTGSSQEAACFLLRVCSDKWFRECDVGARVESRVQMIIKIFWIGYDVKCV